MPSATRITHAAPLADEGAVRAGQSGELGLTTVFQGGARAVVANDHLEVETRLQRQRGQQQIELL